MSREKGEERDDARVSTGECPRKDASAARPVPLWVLCTHVASFGGGVTRVLCDGLPQLTSMRELRVRVADLYDRSDLFSAGTLEIDSNIGVRGKRYISTAKGLRRWVDLLFQSFRHAHIVLRLSSALRRYDVLYVHSYKELVLATLAILLHRRPIPLVWHCHGLDDGSPPPLLRQMASRCQRIIAVSKSVRDRLIEIGVDGKNVGVIHNAVQLSSIRSAETEDKTSPGCWFVILVPAATLKADKGIHLAIEALSTLPVSSVLWITGDDANGKNRAYTEQLRVMVDRLGVAGRVQFLGPRRDIYSLMKSANVICVPSLYREGFGLVAAEGMALGKVVIVSNRGGLPEVVAYGSKGLIFDPDLRGDLARKLRQVFSDPAQMALLAAGAATYASEMYNYPRWAREVTTELLSVWPRPE
jgi:glycosyltransferase involved in cell wall biosynthesis